MTHEVLEAVLAHELAHIRRWDLWTTLLQRLVKTLLFYHPAVWLLSRRVSLEREKCCDELAVAATGQRAVYAEALTQAARLRLQAREPLLGAAIGGRKTALFDRIEHIMGIAPAPGRTCWWPAGVMAGLVVLGFCIGVLGCAEASHNELTAQQRLARMIAGQELVRAHWVASETNSEYQSVIGRLQSELFNQEDVGFNWKVRFVPEAEVAEQAKTEFEKQALEQLARDAEEVLQPGRGGVFQYARVVRAEKSCLAACHRAPLKTSPIALPISVSRFLASEEGDRMGVVFIKSQPR